MTTAKTKGAARPHNGDEEIRALVAKIHREDVPERLLELARDLQSLLDAKDLERDPKG